MEPAHKIFGADLDTLINFPNEVTNQFLAEKVGIYISRTGTETGTWTGSGTGAYHSSKLGGTVSLYGDYDYGEDEEDITYVDYAVGYIRDEILYISFVITKDYFIDPPEDNADFFQLNDLRYGAKNMARISNYGFEKIQRELLGRLKKSDIKDDRYDFLPNEVSIKFVDPKKTLYDTYGVDENVSLTFGDDSQGLNIQFSFDVVDRSLYEPPIPGALEAKGGAIYEKAKERFNKRK